MTPEVEQTSPLSSFAVVDDCITTASKIKARLVARKLSWDENAATAMELFYTGNDLFHAGHYDQAADYYAEASALDTTELIYPATWAALELKRHRYDRVEIAATLALKIHPRFMSARYVRLQGRKASGLYKSALQDARACLRINPESIDAEQEIHELELMLQNRVQLAPTSDNENKHFEFQSDNLTDHPHENEVPTKFSAEDWSDTEDSMHVGNDIPCRYYNHNGCARGEHCKFSHAFDVFSVRDRLGQNICLFYLVGICKFGGRCNYSHSKSALPEDGWWNEPEAVRQKAESLESLGKSGFFRQEIVKKRKDWWRTTNKGRNPFQKQKKTKERRGGIPPTSEYSGTK
ncbi:hypothetical protein Clacol_005105 [Clathrus columnatus]|uniref:C3H1-type domain-containing protein n=1 Tax=Clathrus columnatus TaxID=1419009 RepID=A0AAV5A8C0_9AGAM|nr:hypothetical protein Clacol_005105 [Clathrus columnatus]